MTSLHTEKLKVTKPFLFLPVLLAFAITVPLTYVNGLNIGVDIFFHLKIAESWASGQLGMFSNVVMNENHFPYPPLFHFMLVPGVWLGIESLWTSVFQVALLPCAVASFMFLVYKLRGVTSAFYGGLLLLGSVAFLDRVIQPQPQALDFVLLPLAFYYCLKKLDGKFCLVSVLMVWNHGLVSLAALGGALLAQIKRRRWKVLLVFLLGSSFILGVSAVYLYSGLGNYGARVDTNQEYLFWHDSYFVPEYAGLLSLGFVVGGWMIYQRIKGKPLSAVSKLALLTIASTAVMIPVWADRWLQYCSIPLALLILEGAHEANWKVQLLLKAAIILAVAIMFMEMRLV